MQQQHHPDLSTEHVEAPQVEQECDLNAVFILTPADKALLQDNLNDFQDADKDARATITERVMGELCQLRPPNTSFNKKDARKVSFKPHWFGWH